MIKKDYGFEIMKISGSLKFIMNSNHIVYILIVKKRNSTSNKSLKGLKARFLSTLFLKAASIFCDSSL